jgi:hypothetical protein
MVVSGRKARKRRRDRKRAQGNVLGEESSYHVPPHCLSSDSRLIIQILRHPLYSICLLAPDEHASDIAEPVAELDPGPRPRSLVQEPPFRGSRSLMILDCLSPYVHVLVRGGR